MTNEIKNNIFPIYERLLTDLTEKSFEDICSFCLQWGNNFPLEKNSGFLFVGKAVNGWVTDETDVKKLFDINNDKRIFARDDQMEWVNNLSGNTSGYNTRKSAFWRLIEKVAIIHYPEKWYSNIAWTNLYKIAPSESGNPNEELKEAQQKYCFELLEKEIEILSPKYVIMLTSDWEKPFLEYLDDKEKPNILSKKEWGECETSMREIKGIKFITSPHPQGKNEGEHKDAIIELINEN